MLTGGIVNTYCILYENPQCYEIGTSSDSSTDSSSSAFGSQPTNHPTNDQKPISSSSIVPIEGYLGLDSTMIRRPLTEITLKLDDLRDYEAFRRDQANTSSLVTEMQEETPKSQSTGPKSTEEIHNRIGYAPKKKPSGPSPV